MSKEPLALLDEANSLIESTSNMLLGMTMDPAVPAHAKAALRSRHDTLEAWLAQFGGLEEEEDSDDDLE